MIIIMYTPVTQDRNNRSSTVGCQTDGARVRLLTSQSLTRWRHQGMHWIIATIYFAIVLLLDVFLNIDYGIAWSGVTVSLRLHPARVADSNRRRLRSSSSSRLSVCPSVCLSVCLSVSLSATLVKNTERMFMKFCNRTYL